MVLRRSFFIHALSTQPPLCYQGSSLDIICCDIDRLTDRLVGIRRGRGVRAAVLLQIVDSLTILDWLKIYPPRTNIHPRSEAFDLMKARFESPLQRAL